MRVVIREGAPLGRRIVEEIAEPKRVAAFANARRDGFAAPSGETAPPTLSVSFYGSGRRIGGFEAGGAGASYFIARGDAASRRVRLLSLQDIADLARLTGHDAGDIFRP